VSLCIAVGDEIESWGPTRQTCVYFPCFFYFRLSTFSHCVSEGSPAWRILLESETWGEYFFVVFEGAEESNRDGPTTVSDLLEVGGEVMMAIIAFKVPHPCAAMLSAASASDSHPAVSPWVQEGGEGQACAVH
jgi:hypothetical protein